MPLLVAIKGEDWVLEIVGKLPELPTFIATPTSSFYVDESLIVEILDIESGKMVLLERGHLIPPIFFEQVSYDVYLEKKSEVILALPPGAEQRRITEHSEHYQINFGNNVGIADIQLISKNTTHKISVEIFPRKIDYRTDYIAMRTEVSGILRNLAMTANAKTYGLAAPSPADKPTLLEWFALLKAHFQEFIKLTQTIARSPHSHLKSSEHTKNTDKVKKASRQTINRAIRKNSGGFLIKELNVVLPFKMDEQISFVSFDTPENRYYKGLLGVTYRNILALTKIHNTGDEDSEWDSEFKFFESIRPELATMKAKIEVALKAPFLKGVREETSFRPKSMVFHKNPTYSRIDKIARLLNGGLSFTGNIVPIGVKNTALLYEYWCFLKIIEILRDQFDLEEQSIVKIHNFRTTVCLAKGKASAMRFMHKKTKKNLYVVYNRLFNKLPTIDQKPDNVIQIASEARFYIFDAKYRLQFDKRYLNEYGVAGPLTEDINTMHRYRDAIAIPHPMNANEYITGVVIGAAVLFPYADETKYQEHKFYKSIEKVEIGGIPFLPSATTLLTKKISLLLAKEYP